MLRCNKDRHVATGKALASKILEVKCDCVWRELKKCHNLMRTKFLWILSVQKLIRISCDSDSDCVGLEFYVLVLFCSSGESVMVRYHRCASLFLFCFV